MLEVTETLLYFVVRVSCVLINGTPTSKGILCMHELYSVDQNVMMCKLSSLITITII